MRGAYGAGSKGVALILDGIRNELVDSMVQSGTASVRNVSSNTISEARA
jgi:isopentenyl diphosphate isomerase/L-lactate dehydrogenase-like FMN-dependent dehydrogenase